MNFLQVLAGIRQALTIGGTLLTANGLASQTTVDGVTHATSTGSTVVGLATLAASIGWSIFTHSTGTVQANAAKLAAKSAAPAVK